VNPNATWNVSLESYHPYLQPQEVSKTPTTLGTYGSLPKNRKGRFGFLSPLGVNTCFEQNFTTGSYGVGIECAWCSWKACEICSLLVEKKKN
jgi:hypothetical protein